uniref:30S ribosomal protein S27 n=1 Tax=Siphoviridae sp. ct7EW56 TaxID=2827562 RepID=A0A8S5LS37_9CAUD|nr:MAG TPA: 30S ribosomal protein S27 [Siphoviridae sp. ct7EW56]
MNKYRHFEYSGCPGTMDINYCPMCGCADDYPEARHDGEDVIIVDKSDCDMEPCFAKAHVELKEWLLKFNGGY